MTGRNSSPAPNSLNRNNWEGILARWPSIVSNSQYAPLFCQYDGVCLPLDFPVCRAESARVLGRVSLPPKPFWVSYSSTANSFFFLPSLSTESPVSAVCFSAGCWRDGDNGQTERPFSTSIDLLHLFPSSCPPSFLPSLSSSPIFSPPYSPSSSSF